MTRQRTLDEFETHDLLEAVDDLDSIRELLADGPSLEPPQLRIDLINLHKLAVRVCSEDEDDSSEIVELAIDIEDQLEEIRLLASRIIQVIRGITEAETDDDNEFEDEYEVDKEW